MKVVINKVDGVWYADVLEDNGDLYRLTSSVDWNELGNRLNEFGIMCPRVYGKVNNDGE
jgi:hypothetical protein